MHDWKDSLGICLPQSNANVSGCHSSLADEEQGQQQERENSGGQQELISVSLLMLYTFNAAKFLMQQIKPQRGLLRNQ